MKLHLRIDSRTLTHVKFTTFINGACCGWLVLRCNEWEEYESIMVAGCKEADVELEFTESGEES